MNSIVVKGRIAKDVELNTTGNGKEVVNFSVAVGRRFKNIDGGYDTDFFECKAWGKIGIFIMTYFEKGQEILIKGEMQCRRWQDKDGNNRYSWELQVSQAEFCGSKKVDTMVCESASY